MSVAYNEIPVDVRTPGHLVEIDKSRAVAGAPGEPHRVLLIGHRLANSSVDELLVRRIIGAGDAEEFFGRGSQLAEMARLFRANAEYVDLFAVALDEPEEGVAAAGAIGFEGPATRAGVIALYVAGRRVPVAVAAGDTADEIAGKAASALQARTDLPVLAAANEASVALTCRWKGVTGNHLDVRVGYHQGESLPAGVGVEITPFAAGAGAPDVADAIAAIGDAQYHSVVTAFTDTPNLVALEEEMLSRWGAMRAIEGQAFAGIVGSLSTHTALGEARNSPHLHLVAGGRSPTPPWGWAAATAARDAAEPHPKRPRQTLPLTGCLPPATEVQFTRFERELLLRAGVATHYVDAGGVARIERLVTTYKTNEQGVPDASFRDGTDMRTLAYMRFYARAHFARKFPRMILAADGANVGPGQPVITPAGAKAEWLTIFLAWEQLAIAQGFEQFKRDLHVGQSQQDPNWLEMRVSPHLMAEFIGSKTQIQFMK